MRLYETQRVWTPEAKQQIFRALLEATAYPSRVFDLGGATDGADAYIGILATVADGETTVADLHNRLPQREIGLLNTRFADAGTAAFVLCDAGAPPAPDFTPNIGTIYRPQEGATLILVGGSVGAGSTELTLVGPGIESVSKLRVEGFAHEWFARRAQWCAHFPQGVDFYLCDSTRVAVIPRTTRIEGV